jgi:hypothetical protein
LRLKIIPLVLFLFSRDINTIKPFQQIPDCQLVPSCIDLESLLNQSLISTPNPMPRTYNSRKPIAPPPPKEREAIVLSDLPAWEDGALLHDIKTASSILTKKLGAGYSQRMIRQRIGNGEWERNKHWYKTGARYKISIARIVEWQAEGNA